MYVNGLGEFVHLEGDFLYPMLKSSELARGAAIASYARHAKVDW